MTNFKKRDRVTLIDRSDTGTVTGAVKIDGAIYYKVVLDFSNEEVRVSEDAIKPTQSPFRTFLEARSASFNLKDRSSYPKPGDRIEVYNFTPPEKLIRSDCDSRQYLKLPRNKQFPSGDDVDLWNVYQSWDGRYTIVVLDSGRIDGVEWLMVTSPEWSDTPELQRRGVRVPLSHCVVVERDYGLDFLPKEEAIEAVAHAEKKAIEVQQLALR